MKWHHWTDPMDHPWIKWLVEEDGEDFEKKYCFERRVFSPEGKQWPLVSITTRVYVDIPHLTHPQREALRESNPGFLEALECRKVAPMVNLSVAGKVGKDDCWEERTVGVPVGLVHHAVEMLERAARAATEFTPPSRGGRRGTTKEVDE